MRKFIFLLLVAGFISCHNNSFTLKLIPVLSDGKWGYIDKEGKIQINPQFSQAGVFVDGLALVRNSDNKYGYIGEDGKYIINPAYFQASYFINGLACVVSENGKPQFIDKKGNVKITVSDADYCGLFTENLARIKNKGKWGYIDKSGNVKIPATFDGAEIFNEGMAAVMTKNTKGEELWGYINSDGSIVINYQFKRATEFKNGLAEVYDGKKFGYINKEGKYVINPQFDLAMGFENNYAVVLQGNNYGYIDKDGKIQINPQFSFASDFGSNDLASVKNSGNQVGFIDKSGKYVINPQFDGATKFYDEIAFVKSGGKFGIIGKDGKFLVNPQFDNINVRDFDDYKSEIFLSDYFDNNTISEIIAKDFSQNSFKGLTSSSHLSDIKDLYPDLRKEDYGSQSVQTYLANKLDITDNVKLYNLLFTFNSPFFNYSESKGGTIYDPDMPTLSSIAFELDLYSNAIGKGKLIANGIIESLKSKSQVKELRRNFKISDVDEINGYGNCIIGSNSLLIDIVYNNNEVILRIKLDTSEIERTMNEIQLSSSVNSSELRPADTIDHSGH